MRSTRGYRSGLFNEREVTDERARESQETKSGSCVHHSSARHIAYSSDEKQSACCSGCSMMAAQRASKGRICIALSMLARPAAALHLDLGSTTRGNSRSRPPQHRPSPVQGTGRSRNGVESEGTSDLFSGRKDSCSGTKAPGMTPCQCVGGTI